MPIVGAPRWHWWLAAVTAALAAALAYLPTLNNEFVTWDDPEYITRNRHVTEPGGLADIWNPAASQPQFYPLVFTSYWLEYRVWGEDPTGYHLTNLVLHAVNAALVVWLLRVLGVGPWVAWATAGLFAVHPIGVASVAWAAERKNVLSGLFYLLALLFYLRDSRQRSRTGYGLSLLLLLAALLSKTAAVTLPATALLSDWLIHRRLPGRDRWLRVAPMLLLGLCAAITTSTIEQRNAASTMVPLENWLRPFAAAGAVWFYLGKVLVPANYPGVYPRWDLPGSPLVFGAALLAVPLAGLLAWNLRRRIAPHALWGAGHYLVSLSPVLGLIPFNYTQFSFVADHFMYIPCLGVFLAFAVAADALRRRLAGGRGMWVPATALACAVLVALGMITWRQNARVWRDAESFWLYTVERNPTCWAGQFNLANLYRRRANHLRQAGDPAQARKNLRRAADRYLLAQQAKPDLYLAFQRRGYTLWQLGEPENAVPELRTAVKLVAARRWLVKEAEYRRDLARALQAAGRLDQAAEERARAARAFSRHGEARRRRGAYQAAVESFRQALKLDPQLESARQGLASALRSSGGAGAPPGGG